MEDSLSLNKSQSFPQNKKSSSKKQGTIEQNTISSKQKKKKSEGSDDLDLTNKILSNLSYENFESENDKFRSHVRKKHEEIYIDNVSLLDQNRFRFLISNNAKIFNYYTKRYLILHNELIYIQFLCNVFITFSFFRISKFFNLIFISLYIIA